MKGKHETVVVKIICSLALNSMLFIAPTHFQQS